MLVVLAAALFPAAGGARADVGTLKPLGCFTAVGSDNCYPTRPLLWPSSVAVSPDGRSVYVTATGEDALLRFDRNAEGSLTPVGCVEDDGSHRTPVGCGQSTDGLAGAGQVAVSPDGRSVYVVSYSDQALVRFNRSPDGALTPAGCIDDNDTGPASCAQSTDGLGGGRAMVVSPDGRSAYVTSDRDNALVRFGRAADGALTPAGCIDDSYTGPEPCAQSTRGLEDAAGLAISPDGRSAYAAPRSGPRDRSAARPAR